MSSFEMLEAVALIVGILVSLGTAWKFILIPLTKFYNFVKHIFKVIEQISNEFVPNGGSSVKDALNRIEARQIMSEQRHRLMVMDTPYCVFEADEDGEYHTVNRSYCRWTGKSTTELHGMGWVNTIDLEWRDHVMTEWNHALKDEREFSLNYRITDAEGNSIPVHCTAFPLYNHHDSLAGWGGIISKIEEKEVPKKPKV